jgi:hypothetical protein
MRIRQALVDGIADGTRLLGRCGDQADVSVEPLDLGHHRAECFEGVLCALDRTGRAGDAGAHLLLVALHHAAQLIRKSPMVSNRLVLSGRCFIRKLLLARMTTNHVRVSGHLRITGFVDGFVASFWL